MRLNTVAATLLALSTVCVAHGQQPPPRKVSIANVGPLLSVFSKEYFFGEVYFLTNGGANAVAVGTADGTVLLDAMPAGWGSAVLDALQQVTDLPVTTIINTHAHEDHAGADAEYPGTVEIIMHENSRKRFAQGVGPGKTVRTFGDRLQMTVGKRPLHMYYFGKGHTDGDAIVVIPDIKVAYTGDLFAEKAVPVVDLAAGGSALALPETLARAADGITGVEHIITGHGSGPRGRPNSAGTRGWPNWNDFREYAAFTREFVDAATVAWKNGRTAEQAADELKMPEKYKAYRLDGAKAMIETIFNELKQSPAAKR
jgi:cyclase